MSLRIAVVGLGLSGCGSMGLDRLSVDSGSISLGNSWVVLDPDGALNFEHVDIRNDQPASETLTLTAMGQEQTVLIDIRMGALTASTFSLASTDLPLPHMLPVGRDYPISVHFEPTHMVRFEGTLEIDLENWETNPVEGIETVVVQVQGFQLREPAQSLGDRAR